MRKRHWSLLLAMSIALGGLSVACGDDDDGATNPIDGGNDVIVIPPPDTGPPPDGGPPDSGCNFATYVIGLVNSPATSKPDTTLGAGCVDNKNQAEFKPLFP